MADFLNALFDEQQSVKAENNDERTPHEIKIESLIKQGFSAENIEMKTDLNPQGIKAIAKGKIHADYFNDPMINELCDNIMVLSVSKDRKGRVELTDLTKLLANDQSQSGGMSTISRLLGN